MVLASDYVGKCLPHTKTKKCKNKEKDWKQLSYSCFQQKFGSKKGCVTDADRWDIVISL